MHLRFFKKNHFRIYSKCLFSLLFVLIFLTPTNPVKAYNSSQINLDSVSVLNILSETLTNDFDSISDYLDNYIGTISNFGVDTFEKIPNVFLNSKLALDNLFANIGENIIFANEIANNTFANLAEVNKFTISEFSALSEANYSTLNDFGTVGKEIIDFTSDTSFSFVNNISGAFGSILGSGTKVSASVLTGAEGIISDSVSWIGDKGSDFLCWSFITCDYRADTDNNLAPQLIQKTIFADESKDAEIKVSSTTNNTYTKNTEIVKDVFTSNKNNSKGIFLVNNYSGNQKDFSSEISRVDQKINLLVNEISRLNGFDGLAVRQNEKNQDNFSDALAELAETLRAEISSLSISGTTTIISSSTSSQWTTSGSDIYYDLGNVGIGTSSPIAKLDVWGNFRVGTSSQATFSVDTLTKNVNILANTYNQGSLSAGPIGGDSSFVTNDLNYNIYLGDFNSSASGTSITIDDDFSKKIYFNANNGHVFTGGNFGIGTLTPGEKLEVSGNILLSKGGDRTISVGENLLTSGSNLTIRGGDTDLDSGNGGNLFLYGGSASGMFANGNGGDVILAGGSTNSNSGLKGNVLIGENGTNNIGGLYIPGNSSGGLSGKDVYLYGGNSGFGDDGNVILSKYGSVNGKVGIGTSTPYAKLTVEGDIYGDYLSMSSSSATSTFAGGLMVGDSITGLKMSNSGRLTVGQAAFDTESQYYFRTNINNSPSGVNYYSLRGNLGIYGSGDSNNYGSVLGYTVVGSSGANFPGMIRGIYGAVDITGSSTIGSAIGSYSIVVNRSTGTINNAYGNHVQILNMGGGLINNAFGVRVLSPTNTGALSNYYGLYLDDASSYASTSYSIYALDRSYFAKNVGIGTTSPLNKFEVWGNSLFAGNLTATGTITANTICLSADCRTTWPVSGGSGGGTWSTTTAPLGILNYSNNNTDVVAIGGNSTSSSKFWFDPNSQIGYMSGNLGIGTTSPSAKLDVWGNLKVGTSSIPTLFVNSSNRLVGIGTSTANVVLSVVGTSSYPIFEAVSAAGASALRINSDNLIGIGTTTPYAKLFINHSGASDTLGLSWTGAGAGIWVINPFIAGVSNGGLSFVDKKNTRTPFVISDLGNIGIGTSSPLSTLSVYGNIHTENSTSIIQVNKYGTIGNSNHIGFTGDRALFGYNGVNTIVQGGTGKGIDFIVNNNTFGSTTSIVASISSLGKFGLGTTSPSQLLSVAGNMILNGALFDGSNASGTLGMILQSTGTSTKWVATSSLGISGGSANPAGSDGQIQFNNNGTFGATTTLVFSTSTGYLGLGTTTPLSKLTVIGDIYGDYLTMSSTTATSTFAGNFSLDNGAFLYDKNSGITSVTSLQTGSMNFDTDAGVVSWIDLPISTSTSAGTVQSYSAQIAANPIFTVYGEADGSGSSQNLRLGVGTSSPLSRFTILQSANSATGSLALYSTVGSSTSIYLDSTGTLVFNINGLNPTLTTAGAWTNSSDIAYKKEIMDLGTKYGLADLMKTIPRFYKMKNSDIPQIGFIAQELEQIIPEVVSGSEGSKGITYGNLVALAFQAIKELNYKVDKLILDTGNSIASMKDLVVERFTVGSAEKPSGITLYDEVSKDPYCIKMVAGVLTSVSGECSNVSSNNIGTTTPPSVNATTTATTTDTIIPPVGTGDNGTTTIIIVATSTATSTIATSTDFVDDTPSDIPDSTASTTPPNTDTGSTTPPIELPTEPPTDSATTTDPVPDSTPEPVITPTPDPVTPPVEESPILPVSETPNSNI